MACFSEPVDFGGLSLLEIGQKMLEMSPNGDGKNLVMVLTENEERTFERLACDMRVGYTLISFLADAIKKKTGSIPVSMSYTYTDKVFRTKDC